MGLDSVELVMAIEEKFGITISDEEACSVSTVGDMHRCVLSKLAVSDKSSCLTQRAFHLLRRHVLRQFGIPRRKFSPDTELHSIIPRKDRRQQWLVLRQSVGATKWPGLELSKLGSIILLAVIFAVPAAGAWYCAARMRWNSGLIGVLFVLTMMALMIASRYFLSPFQTEFPVGFTRVRDLAHTLVADNPQLFGQETPKWTDGEIWALLCSVIKAQTGATNFTKDSRFVADLGID
jgi:hypothetical protein